MRQQKRPSISRFEWDDINAATNWRNHGVAYPYPVKAFRDLFAVEWIDDREDYGEERINLLGMCDRRLSVLFCKAANFSYRSSNRRKPALTVSLAEP